MFISWMIEWMVWISLPWTHCIRKHPLKNWQKKKKKEGFTSAQFQASVSLLPLQTILGFAACLKWSEGWLKNKQKNVWAQWSVAWSVALTSLQSLICIQEAPPWRRCERGCRKLTVQTGGEVSPLQSVSMVSMHHQKPPLVNTNWTQSSLILLSSGSNACFFLHYSKDQYTIYFLSVTREERTGQGSNVLNLDCRYPF